MTGERRSPTFTLGAITGSHSEGESYLAELACSPVVALAVFGMGMMVFKQQERSFADVI